MPILAFVEDLKFLEKLQQSGPERFHDELSCRPSVRDIQGRCRPPASTNISNTSLMSGSRTYLSASIGALSSFDLHR